MLFIYLPHLHIALVALGNGQQTAISSRLLDISLSSYEVAVF